MDTVSFLQKILPSQGHYVLAKFFNGLKEAPAHFVHSSIETLASDALATDAKGIQVFQACATFAEQRKRQKVRDGKIIQVEATRGRDNVAFIRSMWLDVDVGEGKDYPTQRDAAKAIIDMTRALKLPPPMMVSSGRGWHCYWPFTKDVAKPQAEIMALSFKNALRALDFKHDPARTGDLSSILRPAGTHWRKDGEVRVRVVHDVEPIAPRRFMASMMPYLERPKPAVSFGDEWESGTKPAYPPSSALRIIQFCGALAEVAEKRGDVSEPLWRAMIGVVKHTVEGDAQAQAWSSGHPQYHPAETQDKYDNWTAGPTTCNTFASLCEHCASCVHAERVKSPVQLGYSEELPPVREEPQVAAVETPAVVETPTEDAVEDEVVDAWARKMPSELKFWLPTYAWDGQFLQKAVRNEDGSVEWVPFCNVLFYPYLRHIGEDGTWVTKMTALMNPAKVAWREFDVPSESIADARSFAKAMGSQEVFAVGAKGKELMRSFAQDTLTAVRMTGIETEMYDAYGWHDKGFVLGNTMLTTRGEKAIFLSSRVPAEAQVDLGVAGTAEEWASIIDAIYNRPGAEPYQFILCAAFGAPLVKLVCSDMWHGIPIALTGDTGLGKTTTCMVAASAFGAANNFVLSANESGTTMNALIKRVAVARNTPVILDEMTGRTPKELQDMLFALSNGQPKARLQTNGNNVASDMKWDTLSFITGNMSFTGLLSQLDRQKADATQMRCFEIALPDDFNEKLFGDINAKDLIDNQLLSKNYGHAGRLYLKYVLRHKNEIIHRLQTLRAQMAPTTRDETRERFYFDCIAMAVMGGAIAQRLGLLKFDIKAVRKWAVAHVKNLRTSRVASTQTPDDLLHAFLTGLNGRTVVTQHFGDGRQMKGKMVEAVDDSKVRNPIARHAVRDRRFLVTTRGFNEWCTENNINPSWLKDELDKRGYLVHTAGSDGRVHIFKGTTLTGIQTKCYEFNYDKIDSTMVTPTLTLVSTEKESSL